MRKSLGLAFIIGSLISELFVCSRNYYNSYQYQLKHNQVRVENPDTELRGLINNHIPFHLYSLGIGFTGTVLFYPNRTINIK